MPCTFKVDEDEVDLFVSNIHGFHVRRRSHAYIFPSNMIPASPRQRRHHSSMRKACLLPRSSYMARWMRPSMRDSLLAGKPEGGSSSLPSRPSSSSESSSPPSSVRPPEDQNPAAMLVTLSPPCPPPSKPYAMPPGSQTLATAASRLPLPMTHPPWTLRSSSNCLSQSP